MSEKVVLNHVIYMVGLFMIYSVSNRLAEKSIMLPIIRICPRFVSDVTTEADMNLFGILYSGYLVGYIQKRYLPSLLDVQAHYLLFQGSLR